MHRVPSAGVLQRVQEDFCRCLSLAPWLDPPQSWRMPSEPSPVLPSALLPASLCGNSSNLDGGEVEWISSPLFLEGFYSLDPACYKLRNCFVISSLNLFLSSYLLMPLSTAFSASPAPWGQPATEVQTHNEDISNPDRPLRVGPPGPSLPPPCSSSAWPGSIPIPGVPPSWKVKWTLGFRLIHTGSSGLLVTACVLLSTKIKSSNELVKH